MTDFIVAICEVVRDVQLGGKIDLVLVLYLPLSEFSAVTTWLRTSKRSNELRGGTEPQGLTTLWSQRSDFSCVYSGIQGGTSTELYETKLKKAVFGCRRERGQMGHEIKVALFTQDKMPPDSTGRKVDHADPNDLCIALGDRAMITCYCHWVANLAGQVSNREPSIRRA